MKPLKILLFAKNGQVGWELQRSLASLGELVALDFDSQHYCGDFTNLEGLAKTIQDVAPEAIQPVPTSAFPTAAKRAMNSRLDTTKLQNIFGLKLPHWQSGVTRMLTEILEK